MATNQVIKVRAMVTVMVISQKAASRLSFIGVRIANRGGREERHGFSAAAETSKLLLEALAASTVVTVVIHVLGALQGDLVLGWSGGLRLLRLRGLCLRSWVGLTGDVWVTDGIDAGSHESPPVRCNRRVVEKH